MSHSLSLHVDCNLRIDSCGWQVLMEIKKNSLQVYELPPCDDDEDNSFKAKDKQMKAITTMMFPLLLQQGIVQLNDMFPASVATY